MRCSRWAWCQTPSRYSVAISACEKAKQPHKSTELLAEVLGKAWWQLLHIRAASVCVVGRAASLGEEFLAEMQQKRVTPDTTTYSAAIRACGTAKQLRRSRELHTQRLGCAPGSSSMVSRVMAYRLRRRTGPLESRGQQPVSMLAVCWPGTGKVPQVRLSRQSLQPGVTARCGPGCLRPRWQCCLLHSGS